MRLFHAIPDDWGPFVDIRACWKSRANEAEWTHVVTQGEASTQVARSADKDTMFVCWEPPFGICDRGHRDYLVTAVYSEAFDFVRDNMLPAHREYFDRFKALTPRLDGVFVHTPWMRDALELIFACPVYVMPVGWDAAAMGAPRWDAPKHRVIGYHGSPVGRRERRVPALAEQFQNGEWHDLTGRFGRELLGALDTTAISLYIAHSPVQSFSTWRLWQAASTSAVVVAEPGDTWPFVVGEHYVHIDAIDTWSSVHAAAERILEIARAPRFKSHAIAAHLLAREFSMARIEQEFIRPAFKAMKARR